MLSRDAQGLICNYLEFLDCFVITENMGGVLYTQFILSENGMESMWSHNPYLCYHLFLDEICTSYLDTIWVKNNDKK